MFYARISAMGNILRTDMGCLGTFVQSLFRIPIKKSVGLKQLSVTDSAIEIIKVGLGAQPPPKSS